MDMAVAFGSSSSIKQLAALLPSVEAWGWRPPLLDGSALLGRKAGNCL